MIRAYVPERPSLWRDLRAVPFAPRTGLPMLSVLPILWIYALLGSAL